MTEFEKVLEECLRDLDLGTVTMDECLRRHPQYAPQLAPILFAGESLARASKAQPSAALKTRVRARLVQHMQEHPRRTARPGIVWMRLAASLAVVTLALLLTGTAYAQSVLPGSAFYSWKRASETLWRAVSSDPIDTELAIANRRADELIAVRNDPALYPQALQTYLEAADRLKLQMNADNEARIRLALESQVQELTQFGISLTPEPDPEVIPPILAPTNEPDVVPSLPPVLVTETPGAPLSDPPGILPTIQKPPKLVPTIEIPPPIN